MESTGTAISMLVAETLCRLAQIPPQAPQADLGEGLVAVPLPVLVEATAILEADPCNPPAQHQRRS